MELTTKTTVGIRTGDFSNMVKFMAQVLKLRIEEHDQSKEFAQFKLPSGQVVEIFGSKNLWHPFTTPPDWELIIADIWHKKRES